MTFEEWYLKAVGVTPSQAARQGVVDVALMRECWEAAYKEGINYQYNKM